MKNFINHLSFRTSATLSLSKCAARYGICLLLFSMFFISCDSEDAPSQESLLPPITTSGENTFGCLVDGKFFKPRDGRITVNSDNKGLRVIRSEQNNIEFTAVDYKSIPTSSMTFHLEDLLTIEEGLYQVDQSNGLTNIDGNDNTYAHCRVWNDDIAQYSNYYSFFNSGGIRITNVSLDSNTGNLISGEFNFNLVSISNPLDTLKVTNGRFDINTITLTNTIFN